MEIKKYISTFLTKNKSKKLSDKDSKFSTEISKLTGFKVQNIELYREAFSLRQSTKNSDSRNFERLEFLGDAVLGSIISQMKSKIVNRKNLNKLGEELQLTKFIQNGQSNTLGENIAGNLLEAFIGAIYLDVSYKICETVVVDWLLKPQEITKLENKIVSYKSLLLEWSQKKKVSIRYETTEEILPNKKILFKSRIWLNNESLVHASESSKKKAEEKAAQRAFYTLNKKENILETQKTIS
jgi:ribonuclease-3